MRTWSYFHKHNDWRRRVRRWMFGSIRTATRRIVPSLSVLVFIAAVAWGLAQIVTVTAIP